MVDAYIACGGNADKSGCVRRETMIPIIKYDFGLTIDIEQLCNKVDTDGSGEIEFDGQDLLRASDAELIEIRRKKMGMVFQQFALMPHLTLNTFDRILEHKE